MCLWGIFYALLSIVHLGFEDRSHTQSYIDTYMYLAIDEMHRSGIPASIIMAQALVESQAGQSELATKANNHFGIKCKRYWTGDTYYHKDDDRNARGELINSCFRKYRSIERSYIDHSNFLMYTRHYQHLFRYAKNDYKNWAKGLKRAGYATDPKYAEKLINTVQRYNLDELDYYVIKYE